MGILYSVELTLAPPTLFTAGGWVFFTLAPTSDFFAQWTADAGFARCFATRVPALKLGTGRPVFTATLFPVAANAGSAALLGNFDEAFAESTVFDDGFAKIVHCSQATSLDPLDEQGQGAPPIRDTGVQLGWDDEDVLLTLNRQVGLNPDGSTPPDAPPGTVGYRVDVREAGAASWSSLCRVHADELDFGVKLGPFDGELRIEVHPSKRDDEFWVPVYFTRWSGTSPVVTTLEERRLRGIPGTSADLYLPVGTDDVPLRYGRAYDFRVRLVDASGGGPTTADDPVNPGEAPTGSLRLRRQVPPGALIVESLGPGVPTGYRVTRPRLGYPEATFAGVPNARQRLLDIVLAKLADPTNTQDVSVPDPDARFLQVTVQVRAPAFDPAADTSGFHTVYTTYRSFPADVEQTLQVDLNWAAGAHCP
jgi:hypothetical protein